MPVLPPRERDQLHAALIGVGLLLSGPFFVGAFLVGSEESRWWFLPLGLALTVLGGLLLRQILLDDR